MNSNGSAIMTPKILLVDDDNVFLHVYTTILQQHFTVDGAGDATSALEMLQNQGPYAVVVTDLQMPRVSGLDFLRQVTKLSPRTKKILFTGKPDLDSVVSAVNDAQIFGYLSKDSEPDSLVAKVNQALREYRREQPVLPTTQVLTPEEKDFFSSDGDA